MSTHFRRNIHRIAWLTIVLPITLLAGSILLCSTPSYAQSTAEIFVQDCFYSNSAQANNACTGVPPTPFGPAIQTEIIAGDTVFWQWNNTADGHTVTSDDGSFAGDCVNATGCKGSHTSPSFQFTRAGTYGYHCDFHGSAGSNGKVGGGMAGLIIVSPGNTSQLKLLSGPPASIPAGTQFSITVQAQDQFGNVVTGDDNLLTFNSSDGQAVLPVGAQLVGGVATLAFTLKTAGVQSVEVTDNGVHIFIFVNVLTGATAQYELAAPASVAANTPFTVNISTADAFGNPTSGYNGTLTSITSSDAQAALPMPSSVVVSNSSGSFSATLRTAPSQKIFVGDGRLSGSSQSITVTPLAATHFSIAAPASVTSGSQFTATVFARDQFGNMATSYAGTVNLTSSDGAAVLPTTKTLTSGSGFFTATLNTVGSQTITAADPGITNSAGSTNIAVAPACSAASKTFSNSAPIAVNGGPTLGTLQGGSPYPSPITVSGIAGTIGKLTIQLKNINSTCPSGLDLLLVGPHGQNMVIMGFPANTGACYTVNNLTLDLDDFAASPISPSVPLSTLGFGEFAFQPVDYAVNDFGSDLTFPSPAPAGPYGDPQNTGAATIGSVFNGTDPNGTWKLYVADFNADAGHISGGWSLTITPQQTFTNSAPITVTGTSALMTSAVPYPSPLTVSGLPGNITHLSLTLNSFTSPIPFDLLMLLQGPQGQTFVPMNTVGGFGGPSNANITFDDAGTAFPGNNNFSPIPTGTYKPVSAEFTLDGQLPMFNSPAPAGPYALPAPDGSATFASVFNGKNPNGTWNLYVELMGGGDATSLAGGWSLNIATDCPATSQTQLTTDINPSSFNQPVTCTATVTSPAGTPNGSVQFLDGNQVLATQSLSNGSSQFVTSALSVGTHALTAGYQGNTTFSGSSSAAVDQVVNPSATTSALASSANPAIVNSSIMFTAVVTPAFSGTPPSGSIAFKDGSTLLGSSNILNGAAAISIATLAIGSHTITATYSGDANFSGSTSIPLVQIVNPGRATHFTITGAPSSATAGSAFNITVTAFDQFGNVATNYGGNVHFSSSDAQAVLPPDSILLNGSATFLVTLKTAGTQSISAADSADGTINGAASVQVIAGSATHLVISAPASAVAGAALSVSLSGEDGFGNVDPKFLDTLHFSSSDAQATLPADYAFTATDQGAHLFAGGITLKTSGGESVTVTDLSNNAVGSGFASINITPAATAKFLFTGFPPTRTAGSSFSARVTAKDAFGNSTPAYGGSAHFSSSDLKASLPADSPIANGSAVFSFTLDSAGTQSISATDTVNSSITGSAEVSVSGADSTTALTSSTEIAFFEHPVVLMVTVQGPPAAGIPTGTVSLMEGSTTLQTALLDSSGNATLTTLGLPPGLHTLTASYPGDSSFGPSQSPTVTVRITPAPRPVP